MENLKSDVFIDSGYQGRTPIIKARISGQTFIIERDELITYLEKQIDEKGYTTKLSPRQQYARLTINN